MRIMSPADWMAEVRDMGDKAPEEAQQALAHAVRAHALEESVRMGMLRWGAVLCSCSRWWQGPGQSIAQDECMIHGSVMLTMDGRLV